MQGVGTRGAVERIQRFFAWTYKDLKGIPLKLVQHRIELDTTIPPTHHAKYRLNPKYATTFK
jgi:hypothetical protein